MDPVVALYVAQPFWIWLGLGVLLLAVEAAFSTEWLLWPAVAAGVVAVMAVAGVRLGFGGEVLVFGLLTIGLTVASRRLVKKVNPEDHPDINARNDRLVGQRAEVVQAFVDGRGRVFVSGAEWAAEIDGAAPLVGENVIVDQVDGARLTVRAV